VHEFLDPATGLQLIPPWQGPKPLPSLDGNSFVAFVAGQPNVFFGTHFDLELRDGSTGLTQLKGAGNDDASATGANIGSDVWLSPSVLVARFRAAIEGPNGFPSGWSTERDFVLTSSLEPFGNGTDDYFPANSRLVENNGVLMVLDGDDLIVMTVTETGN